MYSSMQKKDGCSQIIERSKDDRYRIHRSKYCRKVRRVKNRDRARRRHEEKKYDRPRKRERRRRRHDGSDDYEDRNREKRYKDNEAQKKREKEKKDAGSIKTEGIYIPPHQMAQMMREIQDKSSEQYQKLSWDALRKSIDGHVNKVNATNIKNIIPELFSENHIRGRGLFCRSLMKSQMASPVFADVFAALVAVVNTKFPEIGSLLLRRIVVQLRRAYKRNDKPQLLAATKFIAHLVNQEVAHEILALEYLTLLLEFPTDDSVEVAVGFVKECGALLQDLSPRGMHVLDRG